MKTMTTGNKIMWKRGEIAPEEQFLLFSTIFYIHISDFRSQITYSFVKCGCSIYFFLTLSTLICRSTDISKCFSESLRIRDNGSRLYIERISKDQFTIIKANKNMPLKRNTSLFMNPFTQAMYRICAESKLF